ncbi:MAG: PD-(D/E)XK nuclease family protein [Ruminococcus sp.]|nr:PD-(D/E)XK nuclease family protein [Ruminococcus sp.]
MLQFILGKSGSGKTAKALNILSELRKKGDAKLLMLVPDQNSFETEKAFLNILGAGASRDVKVFGFNRLCDYVFKQTGNIPRNVIDDGVRRIILTKAIKECQDNLNFFASAKTRKSALELMLHSLSEWKKDNITPEMIAAASANIESETLRRKLSETSLVLEAYDAILSGTYIDPLDNLNSLNKILSENSLFEGYTIVVDSFSGFTYQQLEVISALMRRSKDFYITLNLDIEFKDSDVFSTTERTYKLVKRTAKRNGIEVKPDVVLSGIKRSDCEEISFIEKYALKSNDAEYTAKTDRVETFIASDIYREASFVARKIKSLIVDSGYNYSDIAVICRNISTYSGVLDTAFDKFEIPYFMNVPKDVFNRPVIRFISSALECVIYGFEREKLLAMLKTELLDLSEIEISDFENYLFTWNIGRSSLKKEFCSNPSGFEKLTKDDMSKLAVIEATRKFAVEPLIRFQSACKNATVKTISKALYQLMTDYNLERSVDRFYDKLQAEGYLSEADEEVRVYNLFTIALDKLVATAGEDVVDLKEYKQYLDYLISDIKFSDIPSYQDQVNVGVADRVRLSNAKVVFVIGAVDGVFPSIPKTAGAFSETERRILIENNIPLTDSLEYLAAHEKYLAYCALTSPSEKLIVSFYTGNFAGEAFRPSEIYNEIERLFPNRVHSTSMDVNEALDLFSESQAFDYLAEKYSDNSSEISSLKEYFSGLDSYRLNISRIENVLNKKPFRIENKQNAEELFNKNMNISASQLEKYYLCAFQYFCNYGLRVRERKSAEIDAIQVGKVIHYVLENFLKIHNKSVLNNLSDEDIKSTVDIIVRDYANELYGGLEDKPASFRNLVDRLKQNVFSLIKQLISQLAHSDFTPVDFELQIGFDGEIPAYKVDIDSQHSVSVNGFVDRVDISEKNEDEYYIRIVDYKTGKKVFKLQDILHGINMQMLIYLRAVGNNGEKYYNKKLIPSGILYMPAFAPVINSSEKDVSKKFNDSLKMNGLVLNDADVISRMDNSGDYIKLNKKLIDDKYSETLADKSQFNLIFEHIDNTIRQMGINLLDGRVEASPIKGVENGCKYCPYDSVCLRKYGDSYRYFDKADAKDVFTTLEKGAENVEQN